MWLQEIKWKKKIKEQETHTERERENKQEIVKMAFAQRQPNRMDGTAPKSICSHVIPAVPLPSDLIRR